MKINVQKDPKSTTYTKLKKVADILESSKYLEETVNY